MVSAKSWHWNELLSIPYFQLFILFIELLFQIIVIILIKLLSTPLASNIVLSLTWLILICAKPDEEGSHVLESPCCTKKTWTTENISVALDGSVLSPPGKYGKIYRDHLDLVLSYQAAEACGLFFSFSLSSSLWVTHPLMLFSHSFLSLPECVSIELCMNGGGVGWKKSLITSPALYVFCNKPHWFNNSSIKTPSFSFSK